MIEVGVPNLCRLPPGEDARVFSHAPGYVGYDRYTDLVAQQATSHHFVMGGSGGRDSRVEHIGIEALTGVFVVAGGNLTGEVVLDHARTLPPRER